MRTLALKIKVKESPLASPKGSPMIILREHNRAADASHPRFGKPLKKKRRVRFSTAVYGVGFKKNCSPLLFFLIPIVNPLSIILQSFLFWTQPIFLS